MAIGFKAKYHWYQVGTGDFLNAFFSTVCYNLESGKWGNKYPLIMNELYQGKLKNKNIKKALKELAEIKKSLKNFRPDKIVWDINDLSKKAPWGNDISSDINDLSSYFITSDGEDFLTIFLHALEKAEELNADLEVISI